jgi:hypothetical protein
VEKTRIITPTLLIPSYASSFLEEPHRTTRTYSALVQQLGRGIFGPEDRLEPYYYASSAHYRLEFLFRNGTIPSALKPARYHILMAARLLLHPGSLPRSNSHEMARLGAMLIDAIWKPGASDELLVNAAKIVDATAAGNFHRDHIRTQPFTEAVKKACGAA